MWLSIKIHTSSVFSLVIYSQTSIANSVTRSIRMQLGNFETANKVWDFLANQYVQTLLININLKWTFSLYSKRRKNQFETSTPSCRLFEINWLSWYPSGLVMLRYIISIAKRLVFATVDSSSESLWINPCILPTVVVALVELMTEETQKGTLDISLAGGDSIVVSRLSPHSPLGEHPSSNTSSN